MCPSFHKVQNLICYLQCLVKLACNTYRGISPFHLLQIFSPEKHRTLLLAVLRQKHVVLIESPRYFFGPWSTQIKKDFHCFFLYGHCTRTMPKSGGFWFIYVCSCHRLNEIFKAMSLATVLNLLQLRSAFWARLGLPQHPPFSALKSLERVSLPSAATWILSPANTTVAEWMELPLRCRNKKKQPWQLTDFDHLCFQDLHSCHKFVDGFIALFFGLFSHPKKNPRGFTTGASPGLGVPGLGRHVQGSMRCHDHRLLS